MLPTAENIPVNRENWSVLKTPKSGVAPLATVRTVLTNVVLWCPTVTLATISYRTTSHTTGRLFVGAMLPQALIWNAPALTDSTPSEMFCPELTMLTP